MLKGLYAATQSASEGLIDVVEILKKRKKSFSSFQVEAKGLRKEDHPRSFIQIELNFVITSDDIQEQEVLKSAKMVVDRYCSVASTIAQEVKMEVKATIQRP